MIIIIIIIIIKKLPTTTDKAKCYELASKVV